MYKSNDNPNPAKAPNTRVVIIGAIAGGAAAAARLTRLNNTLNITLLEKGPNVSVATCGMPYYIGGEIAKESDLLVHTPSSLKNAIGVTNVFVNTEAVRIDRAAKVVHAVTRLSHTEKKKEEGGGASAATAVVISAEAEAEYPYDFLIIATGGIPATPPVFGGPNPTTTSDPFVKDRVVILRNIEDMRKIVDLLGGRHKVGKAAAEEAAASSKKLITAAASLNEKANEFEKNEKKTTKNTEPLSVTVVGAGFIGIEIAEQICLLGHNVTIVERNPTVLPVLDDEFGAMLHPVIREKGIDLITNDSVCKITAHPENNNNNNNKFKKLLALETAGGKKISAHFVVLSAGIRPETSLAKACGLATSAPASLISVDNYMRTSDPSIYAVGDAVEISDGVFRDVKTWTALATVAAVQARIAADHIALGSTVPFRGSFNTAITRCFGYAVGTTGWTEKRLKNKKPSSSNSNSSNGIPYAVSVVNGFGSASYYNEGGKRPPMPATVKLTYCPTTGRIFGGQVFGHCNAGVDKRLDVIATALLGNLTVQELSHAQFAYAPPFNASKDVVSVAAMNARNISFEASRGANKNGFLAHASTRLDPTATILDVRPDAAFKNDPITTAFEGQRKKSLFWVTSREGAKKLVADEKKEAEAGNNTNNNNNNNKNDKNNNIVPGRYQSICFWGRTSYFTHRNLLQTAGIKPATVTTLQGGNLYAKALKEAERCGSKL